MYQDREVRAAIHRAERLARFLFLLGIGKTRSLVIHPNWGLWIARLIKSRLKSGE